MLNKTTNNDELNSSPTFYKLNLFNDFLKTETAYNTNVTLKETCLFSNYPVPKELTSEFIKQLVTEIKNVEIVSPNDDSDIKFQIDLLNKIKAEHSEKINNVLEEQKAAIDKATKLENRQNSTESKLNNLEDQIIKLKNIKMPSSEPIFQYTETKTAGITSKTTNNQFKNDSNKNKKLIGILLSSFIIIALIFIVVRIYNSNNSNNNSDGSTLTISTHTTQKLNANNQNTITSNSQHSSQQPSAIKSPSLQNNQTTNPNQYQQSQVPNTTTDSQQQITQQPQVSSEPVSPTILQINNNSYVGKTVTMPATVNKFSYDAGSGTKFIKITDGTATIDCVIFKSVNVPYMTVGSKFTFTGVIQIYEGNIQLKITEAN